MHVIEVKNLTKDYGHGRGVFDISAYINQGECFGFLGPNGAGKSTTIRHLMGFSKPQKGNTYISGKESWKNAAYLQYNVGYLPGEIALPTGMTGTSFLKMQQKMRRLDSNDYLTYLLDKFELNPNVSLKQMSLGTKRKLAVVTAFMHNPDILILDEPTSGLDPIMQEIFIDYIKEEKQKGKTIFMSSHIFHEVDACCDRIAIIRDGKIVSEFDPEILKQESDKIYRISFKTKADWKDFCSKNYKMTSKNERKLRVRIQLNNSELGRLISYINRYEIADFTEYEFSLEDYFMQFYHVDKIFEGVS